MAICRVTFDSKKSLCRCTYQETNNNKVIDGEEISVDVDTSSGQVVFVFSPLAGASISASGAVVNEDAIYYQTYDRLLDEYSEPIYDSKLRVSYNAEQTYVKVTYTPDCETWDTLTRGKAYITFNDEFIKAIANVVRITGSLKNCTCNYEDGEPLTPDKPDLIITANDGYEFTQTDWHFVYMYRNRPNEESLKNYGYKLEYHNMEYPLMTFESDIILDMDYVATGKPESISDFVDIYRMSTVELSDLSKARFRKDSTGNTIDMGQFISNLYALPFSVPDDLITDRHNIVLGDYTTDVQADVIGTYYFRIDMGEVTIKEKYGNVYDYINTQCIIHLPYMNSVYVNPEYVINQTVRVEYLVDFYTGATTANVYSSFINDIIQSVKGNIYISVPFTQGIVNSVIGSISGIYNHNKNNFVIEIVRNIPYDVVTPWGKPTKDYGRIGDYTGYIKVSDIQLNLSDATNEEKESIKTALSNGVFIDVEKV